MMAIQVANYVDVKVVSIYQLSVTGHAMAYHFVHRGTDTLWEMHVIDGTWVGIILDNELMNQFINIIKSHANLQF